MHDNRIFRNYLVYLNLFSNHFGTFLKQINISKERLKNTPVIGEPLQVSKSELCMTVRFLYFGSLNMMQPLEEVGTAQSAFSL